jgi:type IV secretory pathway TrbL component
MPTAAMTSAAAPPTATRSAPLPFFLPGAEVAADDAPADEATLDAMAVVEALPALEEACDAAALVDACEALAELWARAGARMARAGVSAWAGDHLPERTMAKRMAAECGEVRASSSPRRALYRAECPLGRLPS